MSVSDLRKDLEEIRTSVESGDLPRIARVVNHALRTLDNSHLLTTTEAAELLGIRSVNTLKLLVRQADLPHVMHGNRMMIPVSTVEQLQGSASVRGIRASDQAFDSVEALSGEQGERGLTDQRFRDLAASRPGQLPWDTAKKARA